MACEKIFQTLTSSITIYVATNYCFFQIYIKDRSEQRNLFPLFYHFISINSFMNRSLAYRNQSIDLQSKSVNWFLYDRDLCHERVKVMGKAL